MKIIRKLLCLLLVVIFSLSSLMSVTAGNDEKISLRDMSSQECLEVLVEYGLEIPEGYQNDDDLAEFVKRVTDSVLDEPRREAWYSFPAAQDFALLIRETVLDYENIQIQTNGGISVNTLAIGEYPLVYSTLLSEWKAIYGTYNCYAYAINQADEGKICPGNLDGIKYENDVLETMTIERLAALVSYDLQELGYTEIVYGKTRPSYQSGYRIIAARKCEKDFHFMYLATSTSIWYHKPSVGAPMRYNYSFLDDGKWTNEVVYKGVYVAATLEYDSDIIYIKYKL